VKLRKNYFQTADIWIPLAMQHYSPERARRFDKPTGKQAAKELKRGDNSAILLLKAEKEKHVAEEAYKEAEKRYKDAHKSKK